MSTDAASAETGRDTVEQFLQFFRDYYSDDIEQLAQRYPRDERSLLIDYGDLHTFDPDLAEDYLVAPDDFREHAEEALFQYDLPVAKSLDRAHVRLAGLDDSDTAYPGGFSPTWRRENRPYIGIEGQVEKTIDTRSTVIEAAFKCQRCGVLTYIPQERAMDRWQEPHECESCERQGPWQLDHDHSEWIDGQKIRLNEPPEVANGDATHLDAYCWDDLTGEVKPGDRVVVYGKLELQQQGSQRNKQNAFVPYLEGHAVEKRETEFEDIEISDEEEQQIKTLAHDDDVDIFEAAVGSIATKVHGYEELKTALFLQLVGGVGVDYGDGTDRGDIHQLMIGDPSTAKSQLMQAVENLAPRSVSVSGKGATKAGVTAAAVQTDFGGSQEWTLEGGALVQANNGIVCADELDKLPEEVAESMHRAMAQQEIAVTKAGINATLPTKTAVLAAANPAKGRWDPNAEDHEQVEIGPTLLSRFDLIWRMEDRPDEERDRTIGMQITESKEEQKRVVRGEAPDDRTTEPVIDTDLLRKYIAYARREIPEPRFENDTIREQMVEAFVNLRGVNGYDEDVAVPVTFRKLEGIHRLAEAAARAELSDTITEEHVELAQRLVGSSMQQFGQNSDDQFDADVIESGTSHSQDKRIKTYKQLIRDKQPKEGGVAIDEIARAAADELGAPKDTARKEIEEQLLKKGEAYEPERGFIRVFS